uniref:Uncharacterized protein n=1 Tax=Soybean thrips tombus-like virus 6 TaxID=2802948 RepID=A0A7T8G258_9TOMB|nr:hypothetical protein 1 [Soybean thrips tombus-like virus 6]
MGLLRFIKRANLGPLNVPKHVVGFSAELAKVTGGIALGIGKVVVQGSAVVAQPLPFMIAAGAVGVFCWKVHCAGQNPEGGEAELEELRELGGPLAPELGMHLEQVYFQAKAETGLVDPCLAEIKVAERRVDRIMREYEDYVFTVEDRARYHTRLALLVVSPSADQSDALSLLQRRGFSTPLDRAAQYHQGSGWSGGASLWKLLTRRCTLRQYATRGHFAPKRK